MKKQLLLLLIAPLALVSCSSNKTTFAAFNEKVQALEDTAVYPYYKVIGSLDFNNEVLPVEATFDQTPKANEFVPYARYNDGFYNAVADLGADPENILIYGMASRSYWLRAPMRLTKDTFYGTVTAGEEEIENRTCANYNLIHIITSYLGQTGSTNPSKNQAYYEILTDENGEVSGFVVGGKGVHTKVTLDNYPCYPDASFFNPEGPYGEWDEGDPLPCYKNTVNAKVDIRFEYNRDGWLVKEEMTSIGYDYNQASASQVSLIAVYSYKFA